MTLHSYISRWYRQFVDSGCLCKGKSSGRPRVPYVDVERVRETYQRSPKKSLRRRSRELQMPTTTWRALRKRILLKPYKLQLLQAVKPQDKVARTHLAEDIQEKMEDDGFVERLVFIDEATFYLIGIVNRHNVRIWGTQNPHAQIEHERDSPKINVFCAVSQQKVYGPFFFAEATVTGNTYPDMLENWLFPQLANDSNDYIFQLDGAPPHFHRNARGLLALVLTQRWSGRGAGEDGPPSPMAIPVPGHNFM
ncbi:hypothetical protein B7P43_G06511 [Cryptotermes secundus]|uniref:Tc1-like transposase DDE domain-containing protein n=1 Tax=Cryptotermes secundus TaxID=105785 RepID=A0A2J7QI69_9NEOP|nr:hypothetical protein B7P43_G06511 [Cryptotermes secundus]